MAAGRSNSSRAFNGRPRVREERNLADDPDLDLAGPARRGPFDLVARPVTQERLAERALVGDAAVQGIGLRGTHDRVPFVAFVGADLDHGADRDHALLARLLLDHRRVADHALYRLDPPLPEALFVLALRVSA